MAWRIEFNGQPVTAIDEEGNLFLYAPEIHSHLPSFSTKAEAQFVLEATPNYHLAWLKKKFNIVEVD